MPTIVIVGAGVGGARAAETLRTEGFDGRVVLIGDEPEVPYERPPLSKEYLAGTMPEEKIYLRPATFYAEQGIELWTGARATALDPRARRLTLANGRQVAYDKLLLVPGAVPRRLAVPGADLDGVHYLRTVADARALRARLAGARRVVIVGMGFIGAEVAAVCRGAGLEVVALEALAAPLEGALGREIGQIYARIHRDRGVELYTGISLVAFRGAGKVEQVVTETGLVFDCDLVVVGVGVAPACDWLEGSGLEMDNGIQIDEFCRTNLPDVYAAGDVAHWWHPTLGRRVRVEHFDNAQNQGAAAARSMLGKGEPYAPVLYFWSDQYDLSLQYVGHAPGHDRVVFRGDTAGTSWSAFFLRAGRLQAALAVNRFKDVGAARQLIARGIAVTPEQLADEDVDLRALARSG